MYIMRQVCIPLHTHGISKRGKNFAILNYCLLQSSHHHQKDSLLSLFLSRSLFISLSVSVASSAMAQQQSFHRISEINPGDFRIFYSPCCSYDPEPDAMQPMAYPGRNTLFSFWVNSGIAYPSQLVVLFSLRSK